MWPSFTPLQAAWTGSHQAQAPWWVRRSLLSVSVTWTSLGITHSLNSCCTLTKILHHESTHTNHHYTSLILMRGTKACQKKQATISYLTCWQKWNTWMGSSAGEGLGKQALACTIHWSWHWCRLRRKRFDASPSKWANERAFGPSSFSRWEHSL